MKTLLYNAKVWIGETNFAESIGFDSGSGKIIFIGKNIDTNKKDYNEVIDAEKKLILPAFTDGHMHFIRGSLMRNELDLSDAASVSDFSKRINFYREKIKPGEWITGGYFTETNFNEKFSVDKSLLDNICPEIPVAVSRIDLHSFVVNSKAIELSGIKNMTGKFGDDEIIRDSEGILTGELKERAMYYVLDLIPKKSSDSIITSIRNEVERLFSLGITSISDIFWTEYFDIYKYLLEQNLLPLRINAIIPLEDFHIIEKYRLAFGDFKENFKINSFKSFYDGSLSSESAYFEKNYIGKNYNGVRTDFINSGEFERLALEADKAGYQNAVHAIGDKAVSE